MEKILQNCTALVSLALSNEPKLHYILSKKPCKFLFRTWFEYKEAGTGKRWQSIQTQSVNSRKKKYTRCLDQLQEKVKTMETLEISISVKQERICISKRKFPISLQFHERNFRTLLHEKNSFRLLQFLYFSSVFL